MLTSLVPTPPSGERPDDLSLLGGAKNIVSFTICLHEDQKPTTLSFLAFNPFVYIKSPI